MKGETPRQIKDKLESLTGSNRLPVSAIDGLEDIIGITEHDQLGGLDADDHTQYLNVARGDARYFTEAETTTLLGGKADTVHTHDDRYYTEDETDDLLDTKSNTDHTHDGRYYTEGESDILLDAKSDVGHDHDDRYYQTNEVDDLLAGKANTGHNHDDRYFTEAEVTNLLTNKADTIHTHDDRYFTEAEATALLADKSDIGHNHDSRYYTESETDDLLATKSNTGHTHTLANITDAGDSAGLDVGTTAGTVAAGDDARFTNARTPTAHASTHVTGGSDKIRDATAAQDGLMTAAYGTKLDGIEALADVTDATNVDAAGAVMNSDTSTAAMSFVVDEDDMVSNSATKVPTQQSVKAYVDNNPGPQGDSAYEVAVDNGFVGTEEEWLESLQGEQVFSSEGLGITIDGAGEVLTTGLKGRIRIPYACTLQSVTLIAAQTGAIVIDVKKCAYADFPTTASICGSYKPTLSSTQKSVDSTLATWTTTIDAGDIIEYYVDSCTSITNVALTFAATKTGSETLAVDSVPAGGTSGYVLTKSSGADHDVDWVETDSKLAKWYIYQDSTEATSTATIPWDDTIPQIGEGAEYGNISYTPKGVGNTILIRVSGHLSRSSISTPIVALFKDADADAIAVQMGTSLAATNSTSMFSVIAKLTVASITAIAISLRYGSTTAGTTYMNRAQASASFSDRNFVTWEVLELKP